MSSSAAATRRNSRRFPKDVAAAATTTPTSVDCACGKTRTSGIQPCWASLRLQKLRRNNAWRAFALECALDGRCLASSVSRLRSPNRGSHPWPRLYRLQKIRSCVIGFKRIASVTRSRSSTKPRGDTFVLTATVLATVVVSCLYWAQVVFIPLALAVFLTFLLGPAVAG